ncbi:(2Fe-2S)-binding protein [Pelagibius marinus]|uniref:(2Fe-2S)-binding protein n=1 Tax=Pelagibius marinus TaxID=2762760 RepID=UPI003460A2E4
MAPCPRWRGRRRICCFHYRIPSAATSPEINRSSIAPSLTPLGALAALRPVLFLRPVAAK